MVVKEQGLGTTNENESISEISVPIAKTDMYNLLHESSSQRIKGSLAKNVFFQSGSSQTLYNTVMLILQTSLPPTKEVC